MWILGQAIVLQGEAAQPPSGAQPAQRVTTKNPKKVEAGKRLAESNREKREAKKREQAKLEASRVDQYYGIGAVIADNINAERKRHDAAIEALQKAQIEWTHKRQQRIDFINNQLRLERKAETKFTELKEAMREYHEVFGHELPPLPREPVLSDFYTPSDEQHYRELGFIALSMTGIGGVLYYLES